MKRFIYIVLTLSLTIIFTACHSPLLYKEKQILSNNDANLEDLEFNIEKISFSKTYQNITPKIEVIKQGLGHKLLASFGLMNSSGIEVERISKNGNEIDIFISNKNNYLTNELVVPQVVLDISNISSHKLEDYKFNIHNQNYKPIKIKLDANEAMNIINSNSQIVTNSYPHISISKKKSKYYWNLEYFNIFDKSFTDTPLINLTAKIDADTGEILETTRMPISTYIDKGILLDSLSDKYLIYKKIESKSSNDSIESLWSYDLKTQEKKNLFTSDKKIISAKFSPDNKSIVLLEANEKVKHVYLMEMSESKAYRINLENSFNPEIVQWKDSKNIYMVHKENGKHHISNYSIENNDLNLVLASNKNIIDFEAYNDYFLITEKQDGDNVSNICLSKDLKVSIYKDHGYRGRFINQNQIAYIKTDAQNDRNQLQIFDIDKNEVLDPLDYNISNYTVLSESSLALVEKNQNNRIFNLHKYDLSRNESILIADMLSDKTVLDLYENTLYINTNLPFDEKDPYIIYALDISKISNIQP